ncbi:hypothetical protein C1645_829835 [Glomus cerebriforme]|uniref:Uncharacterized protein n=1 Tax=Glomus cerebriforme TaxID=658196 RepID=A0A397ST73_9GLOM|nr:hypothetical protein C1645_829835 [Glomus cerebriforme]
MLSELKLLRQRIREHEVENIEIPNLRRKILEFNAEKAELKRRIADSSSNFNLITDQVSFANTYYKKQLVNTSLSEKLIPEGLSELAVNIPVMNQCNQTSLEDKETDAFLDKKNNDDDINFTKIQVIKQELIKELISGIISALSISFEATEQIPSVSHGVGIDKIKQVTFSIYGILSLIINQIQSIIKNVTSAGSILKVPNHNYETSITNRDNQINASFISAEAENHVDYDEVYYDDVIYFDDPIPQSEKGTNEVKIDDGNDCNHNNDSEEEMPDESDISLIISPITT